MTTLAFIRTFSFFAQWFKEHSDDLPLLAVHLLIPAAILIAGFRLKKLFGSETWLAFLLWGGAAGSLGLTIFALDTELGWFDLRNDNWGFGIAGRMAILEWLRKYAGYLVLITTIWLGGAMASLIFKSAARRSTGKS